MNQSQTTINADMNRMPAVAILPQALPQPQQDKQQLVSALQGLQSPLLTSPVESPRHSIILQPPQADILQKPAFILGQITPMPMIVPQQQQQHQQQQLDSHSSVTADMPSTSDILISQTIEPESNSANNQNSSSHQFSPADEASAATAINAPRLNSTMQDIGTGSNSCSIELFDAPPSPVLNTLQGEGFTQPDLLEEAQQSNETEQPNKSMRELLQQQYNQYYQNYQQHQSLVQNMKISNNDSGKSSQEASNTSHFNSSILSGDDVSTIAESAEDYRPAATQQPTTMASTDNNKVNVPISHLMAGNEYPSFHRRPPTAILQSFTPVYNPTAQQRESGNDIYQEYVQNPYNLTLQQNHTTVNASLVSVEQHQRNLQQLQQQYQQQQYQQQQQQQQQQPTVPPATLNHTEAFNNPANYFTSTVDLNSIPPGSEMLFGQP